VCCRGTVDWETLLTQPDSVGVRYLSTRSKNKLFFNLVLAALQIDNETRQLDLSEFKRAFTSTAVRKIYEALEFVWPDGEDLKRTLAGEAQQTSGLYVGRYEPDLVVRGVTRHSLYADRILRVDPLLHPQKVSDEMNPLLHPEEHRTNTLKWICCGTPSGHGSRKASWALFERRGISIQSWRATRTSEQNDGSRGTRSSNNCVMPT
jgi:hypothetical protein